MPNSTKNQNRKATPGSKTKTPLSLYIESFGVRICIQSNSADAIDACKTRVVEILPNCIRTTTPNEPAHTFTLIWNSSGRDSLYNNGKPIARRTGRAKALAMLEPELRSTVAQNATDYVFIHAGVVGWKGKALILPGESMHGKTTLVAELIKRGALYYSDEYAVVDKNGRVHPFAKALSVRGIIGEYRQVDFAIASFGARAGIEPLPISTILFTRFRGNAKWKPRMLAKGEGVMKLVREIIPLRQNPKFVLPVVGLIADQSQFVYSNRPEAAEVAERVLSLIK